MLSEMSQYCDITYNEVLTVVKVMETEKRMVVARAGGSNKWRVV